MWGRCDSLDCFHAVATVHPHACGADATETIADNVIHAFREKSANDGAVINGGFMVLNPEIFGYLKDDTTIFEQGPMQTLAEEGQLMSYYHDGFWQCMDTQREMKKLEALWQSGNAPWKIWK